MTVESPLTDVKGVGPALGRAFALVGVQTVRELIDYFPWRYDDFSQVMPIKQLTRPGPVSIAAEITHITGRYVRRGMHVTEAIAADDSGSVRLVWFNQPYRESGMRKGAKYFISGNFELSHQRFAIMNPATELASDFPVNTARIVPVYHETKGLSSRQIRVTLGKVIYLVNELPETLPQWLIEQHDLMLHAEALRTIHFPGSAEELAQARHRLGFEEVFELTLASLMNKYEFAREQAPPVPFSEQVARQFVVHMPFKLTDAQRRVVWQIYLDLQRSVPMNRLVEGDVGAGKTVVAAMAAVMVLHARHQVAFMAPTELLARQHAETLRELLAPLGFGDQVGLLVGSMSARQKQTARAAIADGKIRCIVGTNALIQDSVDMRSLELVIIDEQHRFGVEQRKSLVAKAGHMPHLLSLTATPIPRSLALTLYGELDVSILDAKPPGRQAIITELISPNARADLYRRIDGELAAGRQMFVVCPIISDSAVLDVNSAEKV
ncbi:MAG TPA: DEAD/DEAH box helicase, partial [Candidatus Saccharimonadales bacterium]